MAWAQDVTGGWAAARGGRAVQLHHLGPSLAGGHWSRVLRRLGVRTWRLWETSEAMGHRSGGEASSSLLGRVKLRGTPAAGTMGGNLFPFTFLGGKRAVPSECREETSLL